MVENTIKLLAGAITLLSVATCWSFASVLITIVNKKIGVLSALNFIVACITWAGAIACIYVVQPSLAISTSIGIFIYVIVMSILFEKYKTKE